MIFMSVALRPPCRAFGDSLACLLAAVRELRQLGHASPATGNRLPHLAYR